MKVIVAESAGFCFGVQRAVSICERAAREHPGCATLGPIIHNDRVISELEKKGVRTLADISGASPGDTVVIRSHGATKKELEKLGALGARVIDATCPDVAKIHGIVREESGKGRYVAIIGQREHPEVAAISSWCDRFVVLEDAGELSAWLNEGAGGGAAASFVFQTTTLETVYNSCVEIIKKQCTNYNIFDTICAATCRRQREAAEISKIADVMVVVGGKNSANSRRLADICREHCPEVIFAESAGDLRGANVRVSGTVGVIAGASTPACIIKEVTHKMSEVESLDKTLPEQETSDSAPQPGGAAETKDEEPVLTKDPETVTAAGPAEKEAAPAEEAAEPVEEAAEPAAEAAEADEALPPAEEQASCAIAAEPEAPAVPVEAATEEPPAEQEAAPGADASGEPEGQDGAEAEDDSGPAHESFEEMLEKSIKTLHTGEKVTGIVTSITATEVSVDLGTKQSGYIPISEFTDDTTTNIDDIIRVGDSIESFVMRVNDVEGMVMLSKKRLDAIKNWDVIEAAKDSRAVVEGTVTEENKGGVVVNVKGVRVFVPASQTGLPKSAPMTDLVKRTVKLRITEVNQSRRRVVGSIRAVQADERREKTDRVWSDIEVGRKYDGVVKSMTSYGVFVDIGGVDGMIHISELSWTRIKQPSEVMSVGDEVSVYVLSFDKENRKISLGYKKSEDNPWARFTKQNSVGDVVKVRIVKMMPFGAFAEIYPGVDGLIHISQITDHRIGLPSEVLSDGQLVDVRITEIDNDRKKVSLSIRALLEPASQPLTDKEVRAAAAAAADKTPVVVYDTDSPPIAEPEPEDDVPGPPAKAPAAE